MTIEEQLATQYRLLGHEGLGYTEFRRLIAGAVSKEFIKTEGDFISKGLELIESQISSTIFIGLNPRIQDYKPSSKDNISYLTTLMIDIDPVRPIGAASTDEQHKEALELGRTILLDIPNSVMVDSGSGCHVYLPIDPIRVDNPTALTAQCKQWSDGVIKKYATKTLKIDSVYDLPRVTRLWGSYNHKSKRFITPILQQAPKVFPRSVFTFSTSPSEVSNQQKDLQAVSISSHAKDRFVQICKIHPGLSSIMSGKADFKSPSESNYAFVTYLTKAHFTTEEIKELIYLNPMLEGTQKNDSQLNADVDRIIDKCKNNGIRSISLVHQADKYFEGLSHRHTGLTSGFSKLDSMLGGFQKGKMYVIAARTNEGKTSFSVQVAYEFAKQDKVVLYFPTELGFEPLFDKIVAQRTGTNLRQFQSGNFSKEQLEKIEAEKMQLQKLPFIVHENFALSTEDIENKIKEVAPDVIVIDFIQALVYLEGGSPREIAEAVRKIKELTGKYNVITVMNSQLNRGAINGEINLSQIKGSGSIEEFADVVMALSTLSKHDYPRPVDLHILKSRYSEIGTIRLNFFSSIGKFTEAE